jgi:hypothetical protein
MVRKNSVRLLWINDVGPMTLDVQSTEILGTAKFHVDYIGEVVVVAKHP